MLVINILGQVIQRVKVEFIMNQMLMMTGMMKTLMMILKFNSIMENC